MKQNVTREPGFVE